MTDAHCHVSAGDPSVRELLIGRDFVGVHPWESGKVEGWKGGRVEEWNGGRVEQWKGGKVEGWNGGKVEEVEAWLRERLTADPRLGVGEIGLDRLKSREIPAVMRAVFEAQLRVAMEFGRPVVLHGAKCWGQVVQAIRAFQHPNAQSSKRPNIPTSKLPNLQTPKPPNAQTFPTFLFHGFSRSEGLIPDIVALGGYISVGSAVLNDHAVNYRALVKKIPLDRLLVETDRDAALETRLNPLTGAPLSVRDVLTKTAELRGLAEAELEAITDANARAFFSEGGVARAAKGARCARRGGIMV